MEDTDSASTSKLAQAFDVFNKQRIHSTVIEEIWRAGFGNEYASIDISSASIELARENAVAEKVQSDFRVGDGTSIDLADNSIATSICMDVILYMQNKDAAIKEVYRVLQPGGTFAFTTWEQQGYNARLGAEHSDEYRSLLKDAGFIVQEYGVVDESNKLQCRVLNEILLREEDLRVEIGDQPALMLVDMAKSALEESSRRRYILAIARKIE